jgi:hypothetical protein
MGASAPVFKGNIMPNTKPVGVAFSDPELTSGTTVTGAAITASTVSGTFTSTATTVGRNDCKRYCWSVFLDQRYHRKRNYNLCACRLNCNYNQCYWHW